MIGGQHAEMVDDFAAFGITAFTTTRAFGSLGALPDEPASGAARRWEGMLDFLRVRGVARLVTAKQVHGATVVVHDADWDGWRHAAEADGHFTLARGTALGITVADCVPVFIGHPSGASALLHSGWRGTAARIVERGIAAFTSLGLSAADLRVHLGPAICGACYEVSAGVASQLLGERQSFPRTVDLRSVIAEHARASGVRRITTSSLCTRCDNARFFSHRAGDSGRQVAVIFASHVPSA